MYTFLKIGKNTNVICFHEFIITNKKFNTKIKCKNAMCVC